ncbi:putative reverse transcriptase domain-containing protein, partial [Tanacetum coccineum]
HVIPISSDSSEESVGSYVPRVILFYAIPAIILVILEVPTEVPLVPADPLVAPEVRAVSVTSPTRVLDLVDYSESDPAEQRPERHESFSVHDDRISRLAWRRISHHSSDRHSSPEFTSDSCSSGSSSDSSSDTSSGSPSDSLSDTSSVILQGVMHQAFSRWRSAPLSAPYPPMTSESSPDSSSERSLDSSLLFVGPSHKRCRSLTTLVPSSTLVSRSISLSHADLLPPLEIAASDIREDEEEFEAEASVRGTMEIPIDPLVTGGIFESTRGDVPDLKDTLYDIVHYMSEDTTITHSGMKPEAIEELIAQRVAKALANYEATHAANALEAESQSQNGNDGDNRNDRNGNGNHRGRGNNRNGNLNKNGRGVMLVSRVCTYQDFVKCQPLNFKGTEGVVGLTRWFEKMEIMIVGVDVAFTMTWRDFMKLMTEVYCPRNEIHKMETELWNLTVKNNDLAAYTQRFQELTLLCTRMVPGEEDRIKRYVGGLPNNIQGNVMSVEPTRLQDAIRLANSLMDQKLKGYAIRSAENKRKFESNQRDNRA